MVIVDNSIICFSKHMSNGIHVPSYVGQRDDDELDKVINLLKKVANCKNVQEELDKLVGMDRLYQEYLKDYSAKDRQGFKK